MKRLTILQLLLALVLCPLAADGGEDGWCTMDVVGYPADGQIDVPVNTVLVYNQIQPFWPKEYHPLVVCDDSGAWINSHGGGYPGDCVWLLNPEGFLAADTTYSVSAGECQGQPIATFTTGDHKVFGPLEFVPGKDDPGEGLLFSYESNNEIVLVEVSCWGRTSMGCDDLAISPGSGVVDLRDRTASRPDGDEIWMRVYDQAGNYWEGSVVVRSPVEPDCGCAAVGGLDRDRSPAILWLLLLAPVKLVRHCRRRARGIPR